MINNDSDNIISYDAPINTTTTTTIELTIWFEGREKDGYIPFDKETSSEDDIKINKALIKPLMYFGSVLASNFGKLKMPKGIEIIDSSESVYDPDLNIMTAILKLNFETVRNEINSDSILQAFKTWYKEAPYYLIGASCKNSVFLCPDKCKEALKFDGIESEDWFLYVRENEPRPQFPQSAWKLLKKPIMVSEAGLAWSKKYDQVTGGFKAFAAARKRPDNNSSKPDGYTSMHNVPKGETSEHAESIENNCGRIAMFTEDGERMPTKTEMALKLKEEENRIDRKFQNHKGNR